jgi:hypothetical protein
MSSEEAGEFQAGIASRAQNRGFKFGRHQNFVFPIPAFPGFPRRGIFIHYYA